MIEWNRREKETDLLIVHYYGRVLFILDSNLWNLKYFSSLAMQCPNYRNTSDALKTGEEI